jgi:hypothetical protein
LVANVTEDEFERLTDAVVVYGWNKFGEGLRERCRETRNVIRMKNIRGWRPQPDPLFDFLHTHFRNQWSLKLLRGPTGHPLRLKVVFKAQGQVDEFRASWERGVCPLRATEIDNIIQWPIDDE